MSKLNLLVLLFAVAFFATSAHARKWTDKSGVFSVEAELVEIADNTVKLRKSDGSVVKVPLATLSAEDRKFLQSQTKKNGKKPNPPGSNVEASLYKKTAAEFIETPLMDVLKFFGHLHQISIVVDYKALDAIGIGTDTPVSENSRGDDLQTVLDRILGRVDLAWIIRENVLVITSKSVAKSRMETHVYKLLKRTDGGDLIDDLTSNIAPESWDDVGGPATLEMVTTDLLIVSQSQRVHGEIRKHYGGLLRTARSYLPSAPDLPGVSVPVAALTQATRVEFIETPLIDVTEYFKDRHNVVIHFDKKAMAAAGIGTDFPITADISKIRFDGALTLILEQIGLTWTAGKNSITITTPEVAAKSISLIAYPFPELKVDKRQLIEAITTTVAPSSWDDVGGPATIRQGVRGTLDVRQTFRDHLQVKDLLHDLVRASKIEK